MTLYLVAPNKATFEYSNSISSIHTTLLLLYSSTETTNTAIAAQIMTTSDGLSTEASMDPRDVEIKSPSPSYFMLTCLGIPRQDDKKYVNMST